MSLFANTLWRAPDECVYLTFDDGPANITTPKLLDLLAKHNVAATFFVIGKKAQQFPDMVTRIHQAGHVVGNHSFSHSRLWFRSKSFIARELTRTDKIITNITNEAPLLFRPPHGRCGLSVLRHLRNSGHKMVLWNYSARDYAVRASVAKIEKRMNNVRAGRVVLLHDGHENSPLMLRALGNALPRLLERGLSLKAIQL